jgi:hypothetical protein
MDHGPVTSLAVEEQHALAFAAADRLVEEQWADPAAAQRDWDGELAGLKASLEAGTRLDSLARRRVLDGAPGAGSLLAAEEVLDGGAALTAEQAADARFVDVLGDGVVSAFTAAHRVSSYALWLEVAATARLLVARAGRTPSLPRRARSGRVVREDDDSLVDDEVAAELALAAGITVGMAASRVEAAKAFVVDGRLPATAALLQQGLLDWSRVAALLGRTRDLTVEGACAVEARLYATPNLWGRGLTRFEHALDAALLAVDADAVEARRRRLKRGRRVGIQTAPDGSAFFTATGPAEAIVAAYNGIDAAARHQRSEGDPRTLDQLRVDMFVTSSTSGHLPVPAEVLPIPPGCTACHCSHAGVAAGAGESAGPGSPAAQGLSAASGSPASTPPGSSAAGSSETPGSSATGDVAGTAVEHDEPDRPWFTSEWPDVQVTVNVTVSAETLMGLTDEPGVLQGYGPIPAGAVRDLVTNGVFRCVVVDGDHGTVLGVGRSTFTAGYTPGARLKLLARYTFPMCDIPGCGRAGDRCDLDHQIPYVVGGPTCLCNVRPLCRAHHRLKTAGLLAPVWTGPPGHPDSALTWVTRTGRSSTTADHAAPTVPVPQPPAPSMIRHDTPPY